MAHFVIRCPRTSSNDSGMRIPPCLGVTRCRLCPLFLEQGDGALLHDRHQDKHDGESYRRIELISGRRRRRSWSTEEKARILAESFAEGANISEVARQYGINRSLLFTWRRQVNATIAPVGRANSPGYGHLKLPHLMTTGRAAELRPVKQDVYFRSLQPRRGWGVERLEATAAKHSIYVT